MFFSCLTKEHVCRRCYEFLVYGLRSFIWMTNKSISFEKSSDIFEQPFEITFFSIFIGQKRCYFSIGNVICWGVCVYIYFLEML